MVVSTVYQSDKNLIQNYSMVLSYQFQKYIRYQIVVKSVRHAKIEDLSNIEPLLVKIRNVRNLKEKQPGHFYFKGKNIVHFHADNSTLFVDIGDSRTKISGSSDPGEIDDIIRKILEYMDEVSGIKG